MRAPLTLLYVPADHPERVAKAMRSSADVVVVDLEDAVPAAAKSGAREGLTALLADHAAADRVTGGAVQVRINAAGTPWHAADVDAGALLPATVGIRVPKGEEPELLHELAGQLRGHGLHVLVESARGIEAAYDLARTAGVATIGLGEADLRADLGVADDAGLLWARSRIVTAAAAAGLPAPVMSVYTDVGDLDGLRRSCEEGRRLGFRGRAALHPKQLEVIVEAFRPSPAELDHARRVLAAVRDSTDTGGAFLLPDGRFVDAAVVRQARRLLELP